MPGKGEYSMMNVFAGYGYDVWTMDHDGYGNSGSSGNNSDIASGVEDLKAAMPVLTAGDRPAKNSFLTARRPAASAPRAYAQAQPDRVDRLVLSAFTYKGDGAEEIAAAAEEHRRRCAPIRGASATPP